MSAAAFGPNRPGAAVTPPASVDGAACDPPQHFLYFFPLPQGQRSFRPIDFISVWILPRLIRRRRALASARQGGGPRSLPPAGWGRTARPPTVGHAVQAGSAPEALELGAAGVFAPGTPAAAEVADGPRGGRRSPSTSSSCGSRTPGQAASVDIEPAVSAEPGRRPRNGGLQAAPNRRGRHRPWGVEPEALATAAAGDVGQRVEVIAATERGRSFTPALVDLVVADG